MEAKYSAKLTCLWLFNPLTVAISTRGSAEPIMAFLLVVVIYLLAKDQAFLGGVVYALAILFKIYPVIYSLPFFLYFQKDRVGNGLYINAEHKLKYNSCQYYDIDQNYNSNSYFMCI